MHEQVITSHVNCMISFLCYRDRILDHERPDSDVIPHPDVSVPLALMPNLTYSIDSKRPIVTIELKVSRHSYTLYHM